MLIWLIFFIVVIIIMMISGPIYFIIYESYDFSKIRWKSGQCPSCYGTGSMCVVCCGEGRVSQYQELINGEWIDKSIFYSLEFWYQVFCMTIIIAFFTSLSKLLGLW